VAFIIGAAAIMAILLALAAFGMSGAFHRESPAYPPPPDPSQLMSALAAPIAIKRGRERAVLFLHGFPSSPFPFREPCAWADQAGYNAFAPLLPGCGTVPADFTHVNLSQIYAYVRDYYAALRPAYREFHLVGSSMGASLALGLAEEFAGGAMAPTSLCSVGCPISLFSPFEGVWTYPHLPLARALGWLFPSIGARIPDPGRTGEDGSQEWLGYAGIFPRQSYSLLLYLRRVRRRLAAVDCPALLMHNRTDRTVAFANLGILLRSLGSRPLRALVVDMGYPAHTRHDLFLYHSTRRPAWEEVLRFWASLPPAGRPLEKLS
jgi:carboxylesterase